MKPGRWAAMGLTVCAALAQATTFAPHSLKERGRYADRIVLGKVVRSTVERQGRELFTLTTVRVLQDFKGSGPREFRLRQLGGVTENYAVEVTGDARVQAGDTALFLLQCPEAATCQLVALGLGYMALDAQGRVRVLDVSTGEQLERLAPDAAQLFLEKGGAR